MAQNRVSRGAPRGLPDCGEDGMPGHAQVEVRQRQAGGQGKLPAEMRAGMESNGKGG